jgi:galactokinase
VKKVRGFREVFGVEPAVTACAPGRVNLLGDHTDYNDGFVLPTVIPQHTVVEAVLGQGMHEVYSATLDRHVRFGAGALDDFARYVGGCVRVLEQRGIVVPPLRLRIASDVPVEAGLSSSAALEVATLRALDALLGLGFGAEEVAHLAHRAEVEFAGVACGIMDQMACGLGQPNRMLFLDTMTLERRLLPLPDGAELLVMHSGVPRALADSAYNSRRAECDAAAALLGVNSLRMVEDVSAVDGLPSPFRERVRHVITENRRVVMALNADAAAFGALMTQSHASLRDDYAVSVPAMDALVEALQREPGVFGARLTGAGFGGCCVALVAAGKAAETGRRVASRAFDRKPQVIVPGETCLDSQ